MIKELQMRVLPRVAYVEENLRKEVALDLGVDESRVNGAHGDDKPACGGIRR